VASPLPGCVPVRAGDRLGEPDDEQAELVSADVVTHGPCSLSSPQNPPDDGAGLFGCLPGRPGPAIFSGQVAHHRALVRDVINELLDELEERRCHIGAGLGGPGPGGLVPARLRASDTSCGLSWPGPPRE
jgi:hypothetical protein